MYRTTLRRPVTDSALPCSSQRDRITAQGTIEVDETDIIPTMRERISRTLMAEGDVVRAGDTVATLESSTLPDDLAEDLRAARHAHRLRPASGRAERQALHQDHGMTHTHTTGETRMSRLLIAAALAFLTTTAAAQEVSYDFDKSADFSSLHNYTWVRGTPVDDELNHKRIVEAVDQQLGAKGLHQVEGKDAADVLIAYHAVFARDLAIHGMSSGWGGYRLGPSRSGSARVEQVVVGTLVIEVIDARTGSTLWRGVATREVDVNASPEKREKNIDKAATKLFKHYPPTT